MADERRNAAAVPESGPIDLEGRRAVVTGAAGGLGSAICATLAREGADIVAADATDDGLEGTCEAVRERGRTATPVVCDVTDPDEVAGLRDAATEDGPVDVVVTCHGVVTRTPLSEMDLEAWHRDLAVNLTGTFLVVRAFYDGMLERGYGKVVCVGSKSGERGGAGVRPAYAASKAGVHGFVKDVAAHGAAHGVYVNAVAPGLVRTPMTESDDQGEHPQRPEGGGFPPDYAPLGRVGEPADVAEGVCYLASPAADWVTGTVLRIDGGRALER